MQGDTNDLLYCAWRMMDAKTLCVCADPDDDEQPGELFVVVQGNPDPLCIVDALFNTAEVPSQLWMIDERRPHAGTQTLELGDGVTSRAYVFEISRLPRVMTVLNRAVSHHEAPALALAAMLDLPEASRARRLAEHAIAATTMLMQRPAPAVIPIQQSAARTLKLATRNLARVYGRFVEFGVIDGHTQTAFYELLAGDESDSKPLTYVGEACLNLHDGILRYTPPTAQNLGLADDVLWAAQWSRHAEQSGRVVDFGSAREKRRADV